MSCFSTHYTRKILWALFAIVAGIYLLMSNYGMIKYSFEFKDDWPVLLIIFGVVSLFNACGMKKRKKIAIQIEKTGGEYCKQVLDELERGEISAAEAEKKFKDM